MIKSQLIPLLPIFALFLVFWLNKFPAVSLKFSSKISMLFAALFIAACFTLKGLKQPILVNLLPISKNLGLVWSLGENHLLFLLLIGCFWMALEVYATQYFLKNGDQKIDQFRILFLTIITTLVLLVLSQNLLSALFCYQFLVVILCFFVGQFIPKVSQKSAKNFSLFILSSTVFLPLAAVLTYKITGNLNFVEGGVLGGKISLWQYSLLFCFYAISLALIALVPVYLLFGNLYYLSPPVIIAVLPSFALGVLLLLFKVIFYILGQKLFLSFAKNIDYQYLLTIILTLNLLASGLLAIFSKNLKQILIFIFFNQLIFVMIEFFNFGLSARQMQISIVSFILSQVLIFFAVGNISLYLKDSGEKTLNGIIYQLRITVLVLIFALLNLSGLAPAVGVLEKFWLAKAVISGKSLTNGLIMLINLALYLICIVKVVYPMIEISTRNQNKEKSDIAKEIELNLSLMSPILIMPAILFVLAFPFVTNF
jgi:multicomponent Na+:H+ antiporter subunit D